MTKARPFRQSDNGTGVTRAPPDRRYRSPPYRFGDQIEGSEPESVATVHASGRSGEIEASSIPSEYFTSARSLRVTGRFKFNRASGFGSSTNKEKKALAMIKTKTVALALALTGLAGCQAADPFNLFRQDYYEFGIGSPPNTQSFSSYPQPDGTSVVVRVGMNI